MALPIKSPRDIQKISRAGELLWRLMDESMANLNPGRTTAEIAAEFETRLLRAGAEPVMKSAGFPAAISVNINEEACHGVPGPRVLREGDVITLDAALRLDGWCADAARSIVVGQERGREHELVTAAKLVMDAAIAAMQPRRWWFEVAGAAASRAKSLGANLIAECSGHGIGIDVHEPPRAGFADLSTREGGNRTSDGQDFILRPGLVLTIEPVLTMGSPRVRVLDDGWTMVLEDRSAAAFEERTVAVMRNGPLVLTGP